MSISPSINWRAFPMLRLLLFFAAGIVLGEWHGQQFAGWTWQVRIVGLVLVTAVISRQKIPFRFRFLTGLLLSISFVLFGLFRVSEVNELNHAAHFSQKTNLDSTSWIIGQVSEVRISSNGNYRLALDVSKISQDGADWKNTCGRISWNVPFDKNIEIGTELMGQIRLNKMTAPANPSAFDFAKYQHLRNIHYQARGDFQVIGQQKPLRYYAEQLRQKLMTVLRTHLPTGSNELAVGAALILGNRDEIQSEIRNAYTETGAIHVLAVSGLHVGFIAMGLGWLLQFGPLKKRRWKWLRLILILAGIWSFAFITGLSPSVQRAATMFSFLQLGFTMHRKTNIYNVLGASAFVLLAIQPLLIFDIGFQLSYLAVVGIVFFQPRLYKLIYPPNRVLDYIWKLTTVAIAAQLTTFPISLYYFHQFPVYFWLSGIVVVTTASFILGLGVLLFIVHAIPFLSTLVAKALYGVIWISNAFIFVVHELPGGLITGLSISFLVMLLLYGTTLMFARWWWHKSFINAALSLGLFLLAGIVNAGFAWRAAQTQEVVVYHLYKNSLVDFFDGKTRYSWANSALPPKTIEWAAKNYRIERRAALRKDELTENSAFTEKLPFMAFHDFEVLIIDGDQAMTYPDTGNFSIDMVLFRNAPWVDFERLKQHLSADYWVFDGSNYPTWAEKASVSCRELGLNAHNTHQDDALIIDIKRAAQ